METMVSHTDAPPRLGADANLWRPIVHPEDLVASDVIFPDRAGESYAITCNPERTPVLLGDAP